MKIMLTIYLVPQLGLTLFLCFSVEVFRFPMEKKVGNILIGDRLNGTVSRRRGQGGSSSFPSIIENGGKVGNGLQIQNGQWVDFGCQNERCLGNFKYCDKGFSLALWVKLLSEDWKCIITNAGNYGKSEGFIMFAKLDNTVEVAVATKRRSWKTSRATGCDLTVYCHIAFTWHKLTGLKLYINGELFMSDTAGSPHSIMYSEDTNVLMGQSGNFYMDGVVDEMTMWEDAVDASAIAADYNAAIGVSTHIP